MPSSYALGKRFEEFIRGQVADGRYVSASEVVRDALRLLEEQTQRRQMALEALRAEIAKGIAEGQRKPADKVFARLEKKYSRRAKAAVQ